MNFGSIDKWMLFGGGRMLSHFMLMLKEKGYDFLLITSTRLLNDSINVTNKKIRFNDFLNKNEIEFIVSSNVNEDDNVIRRITSNTLGVSMGAPWIFRAGFINRFDGKLVNFHGTRLPQDRGGGGFSWRILRQESFGISLIHQVDPGVDTGCIIKFNEYLYPQSCRIPIDYMDFSLEKQLVFFSEFIEDITTVKSFIEHTQQEYFSTYWPRIFTDAHGYVDWNWKLHDIESFICAFDEPYKGAITFINGVKVRIKQCFSTTSEGAFHPFQKGIIYRISKNGLFIATEEGTLLIKKITDEKGENFLNNIKVGDRFYTPLEFLEKAKQYRAFYDHKGIMQ